MFVDITSFLEGHVERTQFCVIGSGPAGMTVARQLTDAGFNVLMAEAGQLNFDPDSQDLYTGKVEGGPYFDLDIARLRMFGGTSGHWGGTCRPLDAQDFLAKPTHYDIDWPIRRPELDRFVTRASEILGVEANYEDTVFGDIHLAGYRFSRRRFGDDWRDWAETEQRLRVCLDSAVVNFLPGGGGIQAAEIISGPVGAEQRWRIEADTFVLATGGIENSRILLWANEQNNGALLPPSVPLGRYWMEHIETLLGEALLFEQSDALFDTTKIPSWRRNSGELRMSLNADVQEAEAVLNASVRILELAYPEAEQMVADLLCVAPGLGRTMMEALHRRLVCGVRVDCMSEQAPNEANRVALGTERDRLGVPKTVLHWQISDLDRATLANTGLLFARAMAEQNMGRLRLAPWIEDASQPIGINPTVPAHYHHMGGTRMGTDRTISVVDENLKVHGLGNLYVAGSSVFPTGGYANPTFTITQLSLRLADHLIGRAKG